MLERIDELEAKANADLAAVSDAGGLEAFRIAYLGSKGAVKGLMGLIKDVPGDQRKAFGQGANAVLAKVEAAFNARKAELGGGASASQGGAAGPAVDVTLPGDGVPLGRRHVITQTIDELIEVFARMGFDVETGPEAEDDHHNFVALNIPETHPARDPRDNFYIQQPEGAKGSPPLLRSQTSTVQIRVMENVKPPVRIISTGRVYRPDEHDATHSSMFHQIEGLYVDKNVTMVDLKTTLIQFAKAYFGPDAEVKLVPSYFPFTEPSAELYVKMDLGKAWSGWRSAAAAWLTRPCSKRWAMTRKNGQASPLAWASNG